jgi:hypothetical protein
MHIKFFVFIVITIKTSWNTNDYLLLTYYTKSIIKTKMPSSGMLRRVTLIGNDVSDERVASIINVTRIGELGTTLAVTSARCTLRRNTKILT